MMNIAQFTSLLVTAQTMARPHTSIIKTPTELKQAVEIQEFVREVEKLEILLTLLPDEEAIKLRFAELCYERDEQNRGTLLHFTANPRNSCNELYFEIAKALYPGADCLKICMHLLPTLSHQWTVQIEIVLDSRKRKTSEPRLLEKEMLATDEDTPLKTTPVVIDVFRRLLINGNTLFDLEDMAEFNFKMHCKFHQQLVLKCLPLKQAIIGHNEALAELYNTIEQVHGVGGTVREFILSVLQHMEGAGEYFGREAFATEEGIQAAQRLHAYYIDLPVGLKPALAECKNAAGKSFAKVMVDIENGECIQTVLRELREILENQVNARALEARPYVSEEKRDELIRRYVEGYQQGQPLVNLNGALITTIYPEVLTRPIYQRVEIDDPNQFASYLIDFPPEQYLPLLSEASIELEDLNASLQTILPLLNDTQYHAFMKAMAAVEDEFDFQSLLIFCVSMFEVRGIKALLEDLTSEQCFDLTETFHGDYSILHLAVDNPVVLELVLSYLPKDRYLDAIAIESDYGDSALLMAAVNLNSLRMILNLFPEDRRLAAIYEANDYGDSVIKKMARNLECLRGVLALLPDSDRLVAVDRALDFLNRDECQQVAADEGVQALIPEEMRMVFQLTTSKRISEWRAPTPAYRFFQKQSQDSDTEDDSEEEQLMRGSYV